MKHEHKEVSECKHEKLTYCKECDVVECECGREWGTIGSWTTGIVGDGTTGGGWHTIKDEYRVCSVCGVMSKVGTIHQCITCY